MIDRLEALRIFVVIAEEGSLVGAARRLQRSPASVTRALADLEADLGTRLLSRIVSLVDEGVDLGVRIARLADSSLRAIQVGTVRRVVCASPGYLSANGVSRTPHDLRGHEVIAVADARPPGLDWAFAGPSGSVTIRVAPRLVVNTVQAALDAAVADGGIVRVLSYQSEPLEAAGKLVRVLLAYEPGAIAINLIHPAGRYLSPTVRLFMDAAVSELWRKFRAAADDTQSA